MLAEPVRDVNLAAKAACNSQSGKRYALANSQSVSQASISASKGILAWRAKPNIHQHMSSTRRGSEMEHLKFS